MAVEAGKHTLAWFKLAEFVWRKEKERALAIYKLLAHSLHDEALAFQLEGDILLSFNDQKGCNSYMKAAALYEKHEKYASAAALYENLALMLPDIFEYTYKTCYLYAMLDNDKKFHQFLMPVIALIAEKKMYSEMHGIMQNLPEKYYCAYGEKMTLQLMLNQAPEAIIKGVLDKTIDKQLAVGQSPQNLLANLAAIDTDIHQYACTYINLS